MDAHEVREEQARLHRLKLVAAEYRFAPARVGALIQPFIDQYKNPRLSKRRDAGAATRHAEAEAIAAAIRDTGEALHRRGVRGLSYHNTLQRAVAALAGHFGCRGFVECAAAYDVDEDAPVGRMDVVWAQGRRPTVLFEIDSTAKLVSVKKLLTAAAPHKFWVYFGRDVWAFKTCLRKHDLRGEVMPIIVPHTWAPRAAS